MNKLDYLRFNTSHVTLYPENQMQEQFPEIMFQYITCYSLSRTYLI